MSTSFSLDEIKKKVIEAIIKRLKPFVIEQGGIIVCKGASEYIYTSIANIEKKN